MKISDIPQTLNFRTSQSHGYRYFYLRLVAMPMAFMALTSCTGVAIGIGAAVGTAAVQEGGLSRAASDARIQADINERWFSYNVNMFTKLDLTVNQGRVLVTGVVQDPEHRVQAVRLSWQPSGVVQVINEVKVAKSEGVIGFAKDAWVSGRIRTSLIMDKDVESINYSIDTVQGTVYLMGFAQNQGELNHVIDITRSTGGVKRVVSYVKLNGALEMRKGDENPYDGSAAVSGWSGGTDAKAVPVTLDEEPTY